MASSICCAASSSSRASRAGADSLAAHGDAAEDTAVAAAAAVDAAVAAAMASADWALGVPGRIACAATDAACVAALRALDADARAADRPTLLAHGPSAQSASRRMHGTGTLTNSALFSMRTFHMLPPFIMAAAVAYRRTLEHPDPNRTSTRLPTRRAAWCRRSMLRIHL